MRLIYLALIFWTLSLSAYAQEISCLNKLLRFSRHTGFHQLTKEEWSNGKDSLDGEGAKNAMTSLVGAKLLCKPEEVAIKIEPICSLISSDIPQSSICYIFTNLGYFFISRDSGKNINFIFTKDNRFSDPD